MLTEQLQTKGGELKEALGKLQVVKTAFKKLQESQLNPQPPQQPKQETSFFSSFGF